MPRECPRQFSEHRLGHTTALGLQRQSDASSIGTACGKKTWGWVCQLPATAVPNHHRVTSECLVDHSLDLHGHFERRQRLRTNDDEASLQSYRPNTPRRHVTMNGNCCQHTSGAAQPQIQRVRAHPPGRDAFDQRAMASKVLVQRPPKTRTRTSKRLPDQRVEISRLCL